MITTEDFTKVMNGLTKPLKVHMSYYHRDYRGNPDGGFNIPSLAYGLVQGESHRHFSADDSGFAFPEHMFDDGSDEAWLVFACGSSNSTNGAHPQYETFDDLPSCIAEMVGSNHPNSHVVHAKAERDSDGRVVYILLSIYWV